MPPHLQRQGFTIAGGNTVSIFTKTMLRFTVLALSLCVSVSTYAGIGAEPNNQSSPTDVTMEQMVGAPMYGVAQPMIATQYNQVLPNAQMMPNQQMTNDPMANMLMPNTPMMSNAQMMPNQQMTNDPMASMLMPNTPMMSNAQMSNDANSRALIPYQPGLNQSYQINLTPSMSSNMYPSTPNMSSGSADQVYQMGMQAFRNGDYWTAMSKFNEVANQYPSSDLADNAYYWMGEIHYAGRNYPAAIQTFQMVLQRYPQGNKAPDAQLKMGFAYAEIRQLQTAQAILSDVAARYPENVRIRDLANKKLTELNRVY